MPSTLYLRNKLELSSAVYAPIQACASISFMALEKGLQTETGINCGINTSHYLHKGVATIEATEAAASVINSASYILKYTYQKWAGREIFSECGAMIGESLYQV